MKLQNIISKSYLKLPLYFGLLGSALAGEPQYARNSIPTEPAAIMQTWTHPGRIRPYVGLIRFPQGLPLEEYSQLISSQLGSLSGAVDHDSKDYRTLIEWLAEDTRYRRGLFRDAMVNPFIATFNASQELVDHIQSKSFPEDFKMTLLRHYHPQAMTSSKYSVADAYERLDSFLKKIDSIPEDSDFHRAQPGERLETIMPRYYPEFWKMDPTRARNMLDSLASMNPGLKKLGDHDVGYVVGRNVFDPMTKGRTFITVQENGKGRTYYYDVVPGSTIAFPHDQKLMALH